MTSLLARRALYVASIHAFVSYALGNPLYGFSDSPNKIVVVLLFFVLISLAKWAELRTKSSMSSRVLEIAQALFAVASGLPYSSGGYAWVGLNVALLAGALGIALIRTARDLKSCAEQSRAK